MNAELLHPDVDDELLSLLTEENHATQLSSSPPTRPAGAVIRGRAAWCCPGDVAVSVRRSVLGRGSEGGWLG